MYSRLRTYITKNKHQDYEVIGEKRSNWIKAYLGIAVSMVVLCSTAYITLLGLKYLFFNNVLMVILEESQPIVHTVSNKFLSFGLDSSLLRNFNTLPINEEKFINLASHLSPAYVRVGGTAADCLEFIIDTNSTTDKPTIYKPELLNSNYLQDQNIDNFTLNSYNFLELYEFTVKAKIKMIFDLNTLLRNGDGSWNSDNAKKIILFAKGHGMELDWQMGNEPNSFFHVFNISVSAEQLAKDYCELRKMLNDFGYQDSILIGPEANHMGDSNHPGEVYLKQFLENVKDCIDYASWHQYYLNGHIAQVQDFVNPSVFERLQIQIKTVSETISSSNQNLSMWISETSSAFGGGAPELSNRFVAGFLWLDKLGVSATMGVKSVIRQSLFGGNYAMIGPDLEPNPDWWVAVLYKNFVSEKVLDLSITGTSDIRLYAHCSTQKDDSKSSMITIYGMNLSKFKKEIYIVTRQNVTEISSFILTSDDLQSRNIYLNNNILKLQDNGQLPHIIPKIVAANDPIILPPYSMVFLLINNTGISACL